MPINNTYTEEFDWFNMSPHYVENNANANTRHIKCINDNMHVDMSWDLEDGSGASHTGEENQAYRNWKNINLALGPLSYYENPVIAGQVVQDTSSTTTPRPSDKSWFQGVDTGDFLTDGMIMIPWVGHEADSGDIAWYYDGGTHASVAGDARGGIWERPQSTVIQYHVPGGLEKNTWIPLLSWDGNMNGTLGTGHWIGHHWIEKTGSDTQTDYWDYYRRQATGNGYPLRGPHMKYNGIRTTNHGNTMYSQLDANPSTTYWNASGSIGGSIGWSHTYNYFYSHGMQWWYAHDGEGNGMIISLSSGWTKGHGDNNGAAWNKLWGAGGEGGNHGEFGKSSGGFVHMAPSRLPDPQTIQERSNEVNNTLVRDEQGSLLQNSWWYNNLVVWHGYERHGTQYYFRTAGHRAEIVHGLTPFGTNADLSEPQNLYLHRYDNKHQWDIGRPLTSYKFGNLVKTNTRTAWRNGHGRGQNAYIAGPRWAGRAGLKWHSNPSIMAIAAKDVPVKDTSKTGGKATGPVRINYYTTGAHVSEDAGPVNRDMAGTLFFEFPGIGTSYGAIDNAQEGGTDSIPEDVNGNKVTSSDYNGAWVDAEALVNPNNSEEALCKYSGVDNALYVPLIGPKEGKVPDNADMVNTMSITLGGARKMVLGPQVLKVQIVDKDKKSLTGAKTVQNTQSGGNGSDYLNADRTLIFTNIGTFQDVKDAYIRLWVETPG